VKRRICRDT